MILTLIVIGQEDDVDLSCDECRYNCSPPFDIIFGYFAGRHGLQYYCTSFLPFIWRYTVYFISGGDLGFSIYVS